MRSSGKSNILEKLYNVSVLRIFLELPKTKSPSLMELNSPLLSLELKSFLSLAMKSGFPSLQFYQ